MNTRNIAVVASLVVLGLIAQSAQAQYPPAGMMGPGGPMMGSYPMMPSSASAYGALADPGPPVEGIASCGDCGSKGKGSCKCCGFAVYADFLYLRPRDAEVAYASVIDGPITSPPTNFPIQISPVGVVDMDFQPGFRFGARYELNGCNAVGLEYTYFEATTSDQVVTQVPNVIRSIVSHPGTQTAAQDFLAANADYLISQDIVDINYYNQVWCDASAKLNVLAGLRWLQHEQNLNVNLAGSGTESVATDIDFYGAGLRLGLEYDRNITCQWLLYAKGYGSLIPGEFRADYDQGQSYDSVVVDTGWRAGRLVSIWDLEVGTSWVSKCGYYRMNLGYVFSAWTNMVQTDEWIAGVQANNFIDMDSTMSYDGLVGRIEVRY